MSTIITSTSTTRAPTPFAIREDLDMERKVQSATAAVTTPAATTAASTAFVAGATGYTGQALVRELRARGIHTVAHVRPDSTALPQWRGEFEPLGAVVDTTAWTAPAMTAALRRHQPQAVFALLGTTRARMRKSDGADSYETVDYGLTSLLLHAMLDAAPAAR